MHTRPSFTRVESSLLALNADSEDWAWVVQGGFPGLKPVALSRYVPDTQGFSTFGKTVVYET